MLNVVRVLVVLWSSAVLVLSAMCAVGLVGSAIPIVSLASRVVYGLIIAGCVAAAVLLTLVVLVPFCGSRRVGETIVAITAVFAIMLIISDAILSMLATVFSGLLLN